MSDPEGTSGVDKRRLAQRSSTYTRKGSSFPQSIQRPHDKITRDKARKTYVSKSAFSGRNILAISQAESTTDGPVAEKVNAVKVSSQNNPKMVSGDSDSRKLEMTDFAKDGVSGSGQENPETSDECVSVLENQAEAQNQGKQIDDWVLSQSKAIEVYSTKGRSPAAGGQLTQEANVVLDLSEREDEEVRVRNSSFHLDMSDTCSECSTCSTSTSSWSLPSDLTGQQLGDFLSLSPSALSISRLSVNGGTHASSSVMGIGVGHRHRLARCSACAAAAAHHRPHPISKSSSSFQKSSGDMLYAHTALRQILGVVSSLPGSNGLSPEATDLLAQLSTATQHASLPGTVGFVSTKPLFSVSADTASTSQSTANGNNLGDTSICCLPSSNSAVNTATINNTVGADAASVPSANNNNTTGSSQSDWNAVLSAIESARRLLVEHTMLMGGLLPEILQLCLPACQSIRSAVVKSALMTLKEVVEHFPPPIIVPHLPRIYEVLLQKAVCELKFIRETALGALKQSVRYRQMAEDGWATALALLPFVAHRNSRLSAAASDLLEQVMESNSHMIPTEQDQERKGQQNALCNADGRESTGTEDTKEDLDTRQRHLSMLISKLPDMINGRSPQTRAAARKLCGFLRKLIGPEPWERAVRAALSPYHATKVLGLENGSTGDSANTDAAGKTGSPVTQGTASSTSVPTPLRTARSSKITSSFRSLRSSASSSFKNSGGGNTSTINNPSAANSFSAAASSS